MRLFTGRVLANEPVGDGLFMLSMAAPEVAAEAEPGQFIHLRCSPPNSDDPLLRRPISVFRTRDDMLWLYYDSVGRGTRYLSRLSAGDPVDCLGPLGRGFRPVRGARNVLMVGGGIGLAPLSMFADELLDDDVSVTIVAGFRTAARALDPRWLDPRVEYRVATDDGSLGHSGLVTDLVADLLDWSDHVCGCGPARMLESLVRVAGATSKPIHVSLEERMACGMGVCLSCAVRARDGVRRVCRDGPVFDARTLRDVQWRSA